MKSETKKTLGIFSILAVLVLSVYFKAGYFERETKQVAVVDKKPDVSQNISVVQDVKNQKSIFEKYEKKAKQILKDMTLEEKVGQMFLVRCPETNQLSLIKDYKPAGFVLFERDFKNKSQQRVIGDIKSYQYTSKIPMLIAVDEEGGEVTRVSSFKEFRGYPFLSPQDVFRNGGYRAIEMDTAEKCQLLKRLGINLNFAPVCDVVTNEDSFMYKRSFGMDEKNTADYVRVMVKAMAEQNMGSTLKHFPGYGDNLDTHTDMVRDTREFEELDRKDFLPFRSGINEGAASIMVSHNIVECMDKELPASLSTVVHKVLRNNLGFTGVIMTDSLDMQGVATLKNNKEVAIQAVKAGNDILVITDYRAQIPAVIEAVRNGDIKEEVIDEAVQRVLSWKLMLGVIS